MNRVSKDSLSEILLGSDLIIVYPIRHPVGSGRVIDGFRCGFALYDAEMNQFGGTPAIIRKESGGFLSVAAALNEAVKQINASRNHPAINPKQLTCKAPDCERTFTPRGEGDEYCTIACSLTQFPVIGYIRVG